MRPSVPIPQCLRPRWLLSRFLTACKAYPRNMPGKYLWTELMQSRQVFSRNMVIFYHCSKWDNRAIEWYSEPPFTGCLPIRQEILNVSQIAAAFHGMSMESTHHFSSGPDCSNTADVPSLILRAALSPIPFVSDLCGVATAPEIFVDSSPSRSNSCSYTDKTESIEWRDLLPRQGIGVCSGIHFLHWGLCDPLLSSHHTFSVRRIDLFCFLRK